MKTALILTTINVPTVLNLYRAHDPDVRFFVAMDKKTPEDAFNFCQYDVPNTQICWLNHEQWKCSPLIGWNTISRRNIALLEALKWGADVIVTVDDDNIPIDGQYFYSFERLFESRYGLAGGQTNILAPCFDGLQATSPSNWFDVGTLLDPIAPHRGFPHVKRAQASYAPITAARVGVAAGICLGDPDIDAATRIARAPVVHRVSELLRSGVVVSPASTWTVWNSQNTAIIRELAPAFFMFPQFSRYDDILSSLVVQRIMRDRGYVAHFGSPLVWQQRNAHDLLKDLEAEMWGSKHILQFADWLNGFTFTGKEAVTDCLRVMFTNLPPWMPKGVQELALAWCSDVESVL